MSQIYKTNASSPTPAIEFLEGNSGGPVGPNGAFTIDIVGVEGIVVTGNPGTSTLTIDMTTGTTTTIGAVTGDILTIPLGATPGTYTFDIKVAMFEPATNLGGGFGIIGSIRTTGAASTVIGTPDKVVAEDGALAAGDCNFVANLNTGVIRATGVVGRTLNWKAAATWTFIS
jgi:hypothetical protein